MSQISSTGTKSRYAIVMVDLLLGTLKASLRQVHLLLYQLGQKLFTSDTIYLVCVQEQHCVCVCVCVCAWVGERERALFD